MSTTTTQVSWFHRTFPGLSLFTKYRRRWLRGDVLAGITVAAYLVPQVMAYATIAGLPQSLDFGQSSRRSPSTACLVRHANYQSGRNPRPH